MKEQELLCAIRNADRQYYEEAEQRIHHRKENTIMMKSKQIRRIVSGTAVAAAVALTALCGLKIYHRSLSQPIVNTTPGSAASAPTEPAGTADAVNFLGGHGSLHFAAVGGTMYDSDNFYVTPGYAAAKSDAASVALQKTAGLQELAEQECFLTDHARGGLFTAQSDTGVIFRIADDGSKTPLNSGFAASDRKTMFFHIVQLSDTGYYIDGFYTLKKDMELSHPPIVYFWQIFDTETGITAENTVENLDVDRVYYDGNGGVYTVVWNGDGETGNYAVAHITADKTEIVLDEEVRTYGWYVYDNCIYYRLPEDPDFYKYDMKTGEKTVLLKDCGFEIIVQDGDTVYTQINAETDTEKANLVSFRPDLSDRRDWTVAYPDGVTGAFFADVCGDNLVFDPIPGPFNGSDAPNSGSNGDFAEYDPTCLIYQMSTGTMQYLHNP